MTSGVAVPTHAMSMESWSVWYAAPTQKRGYENGAQRDTVAVLATQTWPRMVVCVRSVYVLCTLTCSARYMYMSDVAGGIGAWRGGREWHGVAWWCWWCVRRGFVTS